MRTRLLAIIGLLALAGCGHASATERARHSLTKHSDHACPAALAAIPTMPPSTVSQAGADIQALQAIGTKGTLLWSLLGNVTTDMLNLSFDDGGLRTNGAADL